MKNENNLIGASLLTAFTASLCCITPILALIAGTSGIASTFSWIEPLRPFLIGFTTLVLGYAWYQKLTFKSEIDCECEPTELVESKAKSPKFFQSKSFLGIITVFAVIMLSFPSYSEIFYPKNDKQKVISEKSDIQIAEFSVIGMTCSGCEQNVINKVNLLDGIVNLTGSYENENTIIEFDKTKTTEREITEAIKLTGYKVTDINAQ